MTPFIKSRSIAFNGCSLFYIDHKTDRRRKNIAAIKRSLGRIFSRLTLANSGTSIMLAAALPTLTVLYA
jgi:hypothetical protein